MQGCALTLAASNDTDSCWASRLNRILRLRDRRPHDPPAGYRDFLAVAIFVTGSAFRMWTGCADFDGNDIVVLKNPDRQPLVIYPHTD